MLVARRSGRSLVAIVSLLLGAVTFPASAATYTPTGTLGEVSGVKWDPANNRVYTTNWSRSFVDVWDMDGTPITSIPIERRAQGLALEGDVLYAALPDTRRIVKIDTVTFGVLGYLNASSNMDASSIDVAGGRVWYATLGSMESIAVGDDTDVDVYPWEPGAIPASAQFISVPGAPNTLFTWGNSDAGATFYAFDVSGGSLSLTRTYEAPGVWVEHAVVSPDASRFYYSYSNDPGVAPAVGEVRWSDFTKVDDYATSGSGRIFALAVDPSGDHIAIADQRSPGRISVFARGGATPIRKISVGSTCIGQMVLGDALAFGTDGATLSSIQFLEREQFVTYENPTSPVTGAALTVEIVPSKAAPGDPYTVQGQLSVASGSPGGHEIKLWAGTYGATSLAGSVTTADDGTFTYSDTATLETDCFTARFEGGPTIANASGTARIDIQRLPSSVVISSVKPLTLAPTEAVTIKGSVSVEGGVDQTGRDLILSRQLIGKPAEDLPFVAGTDGRFNIVDHPPSEGSWVYGVVAPATDRWGAAYASGTKVTVRKRAPHVSIARSARVVRFGERVDITVTIPADATNRKIKIYGSRIDADKSFLVFQGSVDGSGSVTIAPKPSESMTYQAVFAGDARYMPDKAEIDVSVRAIVKSRLLKASGSSGNYKLYARDDPVFFAAGVIPDQTGRLVSVGVERLVDGVWRTWFSDTFKLHEGSVVVVYIRPGVIPAGARCRMQAGFVLPPRYARSTSPYRYFKIV